MASAVFSENGLQFFVLYSAATNLAGKSFRQTWSCSQLFSFSNVANATCVLLNYTAVSMQYPSSVMAGVNAGENITMLSGLLRAYCYDNSTCANYTTAAQQSVAVKVPAVSVVPSVILNFPAYLGSCSSDNFTMNAWQSTGHGGRFWRRVKWSIYREGWDQTSAKAVQTYLQARYNSTASLQASIVVPRSYLLVGKYTISLTLTNFLGSSSTGSKVLQVTADESPPLVSLAGSSVVQLKAAQAFSAYSSVEYSACLLSSKASLSTVYAWTLRFDNGSAVPNAVSSSRVVSVYSLPKNTLAASTAYSLTLVVSLYQNGSFVGNATAAQSIEVRSGSVRAVLDGGSVRTVPSNSNITLSASKSYDEDSATEALSFAWSCSVSSTLAYGENCTSILSPWTVASKKAIYGAALNASLTYLVTVT
eukprot:gene28603-36889_t